MAEGKPCPYCASIIGPGGRGYPASRRKTCGAPACQKAHQKRLIDQWGERNPGYYRDYKRRWRRDNPERSRRTNQSWWEANRDAQYELNRQWREANRERFTEMVNDWHRRNPAARAEYTTRRRTQMATGKIATRDWTRLVNRHGGRCFYCGSREQMTVDHIVPLVRGGQHSIGNVLPACLSCNCSKQDRLLVEWRATRHHRRGPRRPRI